MSASNSSNEQKQSKPTTMMEEQAQKSNVTPEKAPYERQGRTCAGCFCDMRRAVIIMSIVAIFSHAAAIVTNKFTLIDPTIEALSDSNNEDDDNIIEHVAQVFRTHVIVTCIGIAGYMGAIVGGIYFLQVPICLNTAVIAGVYLTNTVRFFQTARDIEEFELSFINFLSPTIGAVMTTYLHISFSAEMSAGIMTPENYANEKHSCCCL